jgi:hypothetical protein
MMSDTGEKMYKGRKFILVLVTIPMWLVLLLCMVFLSLKEAEIPLALGVSLGTLTSVYPGYLGVNTIQKKIQSGIQTIQER